MHLSLHHRQLREAQQQLLVPGTGEEYGGLQVGGAALPLESVTMPTVLIIEGFVFFFYSSEGNEPPHIHVEKAGAKAKWWLLPEPRAAFAVGFKAGELRRMKALIHEHESTFLKAWKRHFA